MIPGVRSNHRCADKKKRENEKNTLVYEENIHYTYKPHTIAHNRIAGTRFTGDKIMVQKYLGNNTFYSRIFKLVLPIIIQNLLSSAVSSADVIMLNYVGQSSISAVSLASQYANILFMVFYGLGTGATILCAQYYGKGDLQAIQVVEGIALRFSLVISISFSVMALALPGDDAAVYQ